MKRRGVWVIALAGLLSLVEAGWAQAPHGAPEAFLEGNRSYQEGDFAGAVRAYERVLAAGVTAPELEYNLANAYLKESLVGQAILHYRRALRLQPTYANASLNIDYARSLTQDMKPDEETPSRWSWVASLRLGPGRASFLLFLAVFAFCAVAALRLRILWGRPWAAVLQGGLGGVGLLLAVALLFEWTQLEGTPAGVVITETVDVRTGPADTYTVSFRLHEGTEVEIIRHSSGWREIKVSDRLQGWAPSASVEPI